MRYKNKFHLFFLIIFLLSNFSGKSQTIFFPKHSFVLDIGGIGGFGAFNYERHLFSKNKNFLSAKLGVSFYRFKDYERDFNPDLLFPLSLQIGRKFESHHAIFGIGQTLSSIVTASANFDSKIRKNEWSGSFILAYRFRKTDKPFFFQIAYTPIFEHYKSWRQWGGLSIGYSFFQKNGSWKKM